jgi:hypothetical protein
MLDLMQTIIIFGILFIYWRQGNEIAKIERIARVDFQVLNDKIHYLEEKTQRSFELSNENENAISEDLELLEDYLGVEQKHTPCKTEYKKVKK